MSLSIMAQAMVVVTLFPTLEVMTLTSCPVSGRVSFSFPLMYSSVSRVSLSAIEYGAYPTPKEVSFAMCPDAL